MMLIETLPSEAYLNEKYPGLPAPRMRHEHADLVQNIVEVLKQIPGYVARPYIDIYPEDELESARQPDVLVMPEAKAQKKGTLPLRYYDAPEIVFEVTSPATYEIDHLDKVRIYMNWGIPVYVILDIENRMLRVVDSTGRDEDFNDPFERIKLTAELDIYWGGDETNFKAWWKDKPLVNLLKMARANAQQRHIIEKQGMALNEKDRALNEKDKEIEELRRKLREAGL